jgi:hypothetical protein
VGMDNPLAKGAPHATLIHGWVMSADSKGYAIAEDGNVIEVVANDACERCGGDSSWSDPRDTRPASATVCLSCYIQCER